MGKESASRTKELYNLPSLVLKARHLGGSAFCNFICWECLGGILLGFGIVVEDKPSELSCTFCAPTTPTPSFFGVAH